MSEQPTNRAAGSDGRAQWQRARLRPEGVTAPAHWQASEVPAAAEPDAVPAEDQPGGRDPVRYGDWEYKGLAIDF